MSKRRWLRGLQEIIGLDRAIAFTVAARLLLGVGSIVTVLLIVHLLTPVEQGYYYTLWSLVALQVVFELGFSFVILQTTAHEGAHLQFFPDGTISGPEESQHRLAIILQRSARWYLLAAIVMGTVMMVGGRHFFALHSVNGDTLWIWPMRVTILACCVTFSIGPVVSFLEGTGMVTDVARMRFSQSFVASGLAWTAMLTHHGLFAPAMVLSGQGLVALMLIVRRRRLLLPLILKRTHRTALCWRREVWPFQWRIAVSWMCDYFIFQMFTPVLFAFRGPVEAGRMGLSMSAVTQMGGVVLAWMSTKAAPFGTLVARRDSAALDRLFFRTLRQSLAVLGCGSILLLSAVMLIPHLFPHFQDRLVSWQVFALLLLTGASSHVVQSLALYLRAHKVEPFLAQSVAVASATTLLALLAVQPWGTTGVALAYFASLGVGGLISATAIFFRMRRRLSDSRPKVIPIHYRLEDGAI